MTKASSNLQDKPIKSATLLIFIGVLLLSANLRAPFTSVAPVLGQIMQDLSLAASSAGFLTALPLLCFAIFSPMCASLSRKIGLYPSLVVGLVSISAGVILRSLGFEFPLFFGTILIGLGIAIGNVLLPVVVKVNFPHKISTTTSLYVFTMGIASTISAGLMVPISHLDIGALSGWQGALGFNLIFPLLALLIWLPKVFTRTKAAPSTTTDTHTKMSSLLRSPVAWQVTLGIGLNSFTFYSFAGWLPKMLNEIGYSEIEAGYLYSLMQFATILPGLVLIPLMSRAKLQRPLITLTSFCLSATVLGIAFAPQFALVWVVLFGFCNCATFIIGMSFVGLRTDTPAQAAALSGLSQSIGYGFAATGPTIVGSMYAMTNHWTLPLMFIAAVGLVCMVFANLAARDKKVL